MIYKGDVVTKSIVIFDETHPTHVDRLLYPTISVFDDIIFSILKTFIILSHPNTDSNNYNPNE